MIIRELFKAMLAGLGSVVQHPDIRVLHLKLYFLTYVLTYFTGPTMELTS